VRRRWDVWRLRPLPGEFNLTLGEAAEDLGISREAVHRLVQRKTLDARRVGRRPIVLVREKDVRALPVSPQRKRELARESAEDFADAAAAREARASIEAGEPVIPWEQVKAEAAAELGDELPEG
jgi:excisionase family DNA binding protein